MTTIIELLHYVSKGGQLIQRIIVMNSLTQYFYDDEDSNDYNY